MFAGATFLATQYTLRVRSATVTARDHAGSVTIVGAVMSIDAPGVVDRPVEIHRAWIERVEESSGISTTATLFSFRSVRRVCVIHLDRPIGVPQSLDAPTMLRDPARVPRAAVPMTSIGLDLEELPVATTALGDWASAPAGTVPGPPPAPGPKRDTGQRCRVAAYVATALALLGAWAPLP